MSFKPVNKNLKNYVMSRKWKEFTAGEFAIGTLEECDQVDKFGKPIFAIKIIETNFNYPVGTNLYLNCGGNFQNDMSQVEVGEKVKISYDGEVEIKKGKWKGSMTHSILVQVEAKDEASEDLI